MKILFITAEGFDTPNPNNQMAETMLREFMERGHSVHLIQSHRKGVNPDLPASLAGNSALTVDTIVRKVVDKSNFVRRYLNDMHYALQAMRYWRRVKDADVIYLQSNPTIIYPILLLKLFKRQVPIVYSIYDVFPGHAYDIGVIKSKFVYKVLAAIQRPCYKLADAVLVLSADMSRKVKEQGASEQKVFVVPAWYDVNTTREIPWKENRFVQKFDLQPDKFYLQFAGTIGYILDYKTILELAKRLVNEENIVIQIIGDGNVKERFVQEAQELGLKNIEFYPLQPIEIVPDVYSACSASLIPLKKGVIGNGVPSKAAILMACRRLIISTVETDSDYADMFRRNDMGIAVENGNYDRLAEIIRSLPEQPERIAKMVENAHQFGSENYTSAKSIQIIMDVFEKVVER